MKMYLSFMIDDAASFRFFFFLNELTRPLDYAKVFFGGSIVDRCLDHSQGKHALPHFLWVVIKTYLYLLKMYLYFMGEHVLFSLQIYNWSLRSISSEQNGGNFIFFLKMMVIRHAKLHPGQTELQSNWWRIYIYNDDMEEEEGEEE